MKHNPPVGRLIDGFLSAIKVTVAPKTYEYYEWYLTEFRAFAGGYRINSLTSSIVYAWIDKRYGSHSPSSQFAAARAVTRLINWSINEQIIDRSPLVGFRKPAPCSREIIITPAQYVQCIKHGRELRDVIKFLWHTGCRPQELRAIEGRWVQGRKIVFPEQASKGHRYRKRKRRVIYLDSMAAGIMLRLADTYPKGPTFRNSAGTPWTNYALVTAFARLRKRTGIRELYPYAFRHTWITRMLERGVDVATVASLAGNSPQLVLSVYQHVAANESRLLSLFE